MINQTQLPAYVAILILATLVESFVEYLIRPLVKPWVQGQPPARLVGEEPAVTIRDLILRYVAAVIGMGACVLYRADLLAMMGLDSPWPWVGYLVTGLIIGRGANFVHDFAGRWLQPTR